SETSQRYGATRIPKGSTVEDWPFGLEELEPYYDKVEYEIGVSGQAGNIQGPTAAGSVSPDTPSSFVAVRGQGPESRSLHRRKQERTVAGGRRDAGTAASARLSDARPIPGRSLAPGRRPKTRYDTGHWSDLQQSAGVDPQALGGIVGGGLAILRWPPAPA